MKGRERVWGIREGVGGREGREGVCGYGSEGRQGGDVRMESRTRRIKCVTVRCVRG